GYEHLTIQIKELARTYAKSKSLIIWGLGVTEHLDGSFAVSAIANLALLTGNIGKVGAGIMPLRGQNNVQGTCDMGCLPNYLPDYKKPEVEGLKSIEMFDEMIHGNVKAIYNLGEDLTHIHANLNKINKAIQNLELLVVNDIVDVSISKKADIIFGVKSAYEKIGVYVNAERRLHLNQPLVESNRLDDWEVLQLIANFMNTNWSYKNSKDIWQEIQKEVSRYSGASYEMLLENRDGLQWPILDKDTKRLYEQKFHTKTSLGKFRYKQYDLRGFTKALYEKSTPKMTLTTGRIVYHYNNASQTKESLKLLEYHDEDVVYISHEDIKSIDINKKHILKSLYGETKPLQFKESKSLKKGVLYTTFHHFESNINALFGDEGDCFTKTSRFKAVEVEII
ncbi:MAG: molybdopterin-dependent oxidoreductase, partial [Campylobacterales bacterium]|nr:molybdopterin-dependent oxidoreductase [Campylobacterales bacterium]